MKIPMMFSCGMVSEWFQSYLVGLYQYFWTGSSTSSATLIVCGVAYRRGPFSRPHSLSAVHRRSHSTDPESRSSPSSVRRRHPGIWILSTVGVTGAAEHHHQLRQRRCFNWMRSNRLQLNSAKTEILWSATSRRSCQLPQSSLRVCTDEVLPATVVHDLGIYIDSDVSMRSQLGHEDSFLVLRCTASAASVRRSLPRSILQTLVTSLVLTRLDFGNATCRVQ